MTTALPHPHEEALKAFSKQAAHFDLDDAANPILKIWRRQVYQHTEKFLKPSSRILELNAGTGIDASYFASQGHRVHATDAADGMMSEMQKKINYDNFEGRLTSQQVSFDQLDQVQGSFDYVYSNFGGLNCIQDLTPVTQSISHLLSPGGIITWVVMPPICPWEWTWVFKGKLNVAFRRLSQQGTTAHLEGHYFNTHYHPLSKIQKALGADFKLLKAEGLGSFSPPPASLSFEKHFPRLSTSLRQLENKMKHLFPFNRWGDHIIVTFQKVR